MKFAYVIFFIFTSVKAEYRAYQYLVKNRSDTQSAQPQIVVSTLDPKSYVSYFGGSTIIGVELLRSWQCFGNTSKKDICSPPQIAGDSP